MNTKNVDIIEESIPVVIKKFTTRDGSVFISEGNQDWQIQKAKDAADYRNLEYDFLHFKVDENLLSVYKSENWLHFKWYIFKNGILCYKLKKSYDNVIYNNYYDIKHFNEITESEFRLLVKKALFQKPYDNSTLTIKPELLNNEFIFNVIFFSGLIDFKDSNDILEMYLKSDRVKEEIYKTFLSEHEKYYTDKLNDRIFGVVAYTENEKYLEKVVKSGILKPNLTHLTNIGYNLFLDEYFNKFKEIKGTKNTVKNGNSAYTFSFRSINSSESYFKKYMSLCTESRIEILKAILFNHNYDLFINSNYGMLCMYYQHFYNMNEKDSFKKAEEIHSAFLFVSHNSRYECLKQYAKPDNELYDIIINVSVFSNDRYDRLEYISSVFNYLIENFPDKKSELDIYVVWSSEGKFIPKSYEFMKTLTDKKFYIKHEKLVKNTGTDYNVRYSFEEFKNHVSAMGINYII